MFFVHVMIIETAQINKMKLKLTFTCEQKFISGFYEILNIPDKLHGILKSSKR